ncbi:MAG TPA: MbtH family protein [Acidobacteriota bacterium]|nr:MbtH family protein [Acidobacteriota bacterium]
MDNENGKEKYHVVINHEEQYSIWPDYRDMPPGWKEAGFSGSKEECLDHIEEVWTDMRPLSLRKKMEELKNNPPPEPEVTDEPEEETLVERLSKGRHPVEISLRPDRKLSRFKECLDRGYVHIKFTETRGGTELGVRLTPEQTDLSGADFEGGSGEAKLAGSLTLDFVKVDCFATINLPDMVGEGYLAPAKA